MAGFKLPLGFIADNDGIFGHWLETDLERYFEIEVSRTPPGQPWCNGICERFHRNLKSEVLERVGALDLATIQRLSASYQEYFNSRRPHQGIVGGTPALTIGLSSPPAQSRKIRYCKTAEVDGLITNFRLAA